MTSGCSCCLCAVLLLESLLLVLGSVKRTPKCASHISLLHVLLTLKKKGC